MLLTSKQLNPLLFPIAIFNLAAMSQSTKTITLPPFNLSANSDTDIWRKVLSTSYSSTSRGFTPVLTNLKPPSHNAFNAPTHPDPLPQYKLSEFQSAKLTFALPVANTLLQYDQAGLLLHLTKKGETDKWIKTGIEYYYSNPYISTVGCDSWADWSIVPLSPYGGNETRPSTTIEAKREKDVLGKSLWVYQVIYGDDGEEKERRPLRELTWVFGEEDGWNIGVGGYVARPNNDTKGILEAEFEKGVEVVVSCEETK
jgi:hypothetical protein